MMTAIKHKKVLLFLVNFFVTYFIGLALYNIYLNTFQNKMIGFECDPITVSVADLTCNGIQYLGFSSFYEPHATEFSLNLFVDNVLLVRIIEGCNAISVIVLFVAFVVAFRTRFLPTLLFVVVGSLLIYYFNIIRIVGIVVGMQQYPSLTGFLHDILFPVIIYGFVFLLWVIWVNYFATLTTKKG